MIELSKSFNFDTGPTLQRSIKAEPSRRFHGHSHRAEVAMWIWHRFEPKLPGLSCVTVRSEIAGETCRYLEPKAMA
ncbi:hypothetical protein [Bosea sp. BIWAKO-01]|uniref:hypothetical protein n=1 Tax=Bosea sp. BIWAKO-01 TaxID=506668 RepID=UPI000852DA70|nr:hypothetical protein [Bosea sp. BIWAKO-01]